MNTKEKLIKELSKVNEQLVVYKFKNVFKTTKRIHRL